MTIDPQEPKAGYRRYFYFLRHRVTGEIIELGQTNVLDPEVAAAHGIGIDPVVDSDWLFDFRTEKV